MSQESEILRHIENQRRVAKISELTQQLIDTTNVMGGDDLVVAGILDGIQRSHRTLQQSFVRGIVGAMKEYGESESYDARNEQAVKIAKKIGELEEHLPFI